MKLIARVVNVEQWAKEGPLSGYEHSLLNNYNDKPILTRPQQRFFTGKDYLEVDLDVHTYAWLARKAFANFIPRLGKGLGCLHNGKAITANLTTAHTAWMLCNLARPISAK